MTDITIFIVFKEGPKTMSYLKSGNFFETYGNEGSSVICQWNTLYLFISIRSRLS